MRTCESSSTTTWNPRGTRPSVERSVQRDWTCLLDAITEDGDRSCFRFEEYVTADRAKHFILVLCRWFEGDLLDGLKTAIDTALEQRSLPEASDYL